MLSDLITFERTIAPAAPALHILEVKDQIRDSDATEGVLLRLVNAATEQLDGIDGLLGRCLVTQTWRMKLNAWPGNDLYRGPYLDTVNVRSGELRIPLPPVQSVDSIAYRDIDGVSQTVDLSDYHVETAGDYARVIPRDGAAWPNVSATWLAPITVTWTAGYGDTWQSVPEPIRQALLLRIARWYDKRHEDVDLAADWPQSLMSLLTPYRILSWRS